MSEHETKPEPTPYEPQVIGVLAEFDGPEELVAGARAIREKGYRKVEAYSPFPVHGIDEALAAPKPLLPWVVLGAGLTGCLVAILMQWYMNAFEAPIPFSGYDYRISGKPAWSLPANIPVTFELIILFSAFTSFLGMIAFNALPKFSNPLFRNDRFLKATDDKFFLVVDADDPQFATETLSGAFREIGAKHVEPLSDQPTTPLPSWVVPACTIVAVIALVPLALVLLNRGGTSETPRLSIWWDMDYQPKYKAQTTIEPRIFADGRADRKPVAGTVSREGLSIDTRLYDGYRSEGEQTFNTALLLPQEEEDEPPSGDDSSQEDSSEDDSSEDDSSEGESSGEDSESGDEASTADETGGEGQAEAPPEPYDWITEFPDEIEINKTTMQRGHQRFNIYCAVCHGRAGDGDGLVAQRALELKAPTWRPPTSLHQENVTKYPVGKLFNIISYGNIAGVTPDGGVIRGGMAGYESQISVEDRWAIVLYVKALEKTRTASPDELTEQELNSLRQ